MDDIHRRKQFMEALHYEPLDSARVRNSQVLSATWDIVVTAPRLSVRVWMAPAAPGGSTQALPARQNYRPIIKEPVVTGPPAGALLHDFPHHAALLTMRLE